MEKEVKEEEEQTTICSSCKKIIYKYEKCSCQKEKNDNTNGDWTKFKK